MFIPRPLIIAIAVVGLLILFVSIFSSVPASLLLEIFLVAVLVAISIGWISTRKGNGQLSAAGKKGSQTDVRVNEMRVEMDKLRRHQRQILLDLPLGVCAIDNKEHITIWNRALERMTGLKAAQIQGTRLTDLNEPWLSLLHKFVDSSYTHLYKQSYVSNGKKHTVNLHKSIIEQPSESSPDEGGFLVLLEDVTETEMLEAGLTHSERLASIGRLAAGVAHEIGNPITGIACLAQNIRDEFEDPDLTQMASQIIEQTARTSRIVQSLVSFAHAGSSVSGSAYDRVCVKDCIDEAITLISLDKKGKSMRYEVDCDAAICLLGDSQRLLQVLLNLINNSRDASQPDSTIRVSCEQVGETVRIIVEDEGIGIPSAVRDRVFDPFFTTKEAGEGTGLGLSLVYSIVEDLRGNIDIISPSMQNTARGTRVVLDFPAPGQGELPSSPAENAEAQS